MAAVGVSFDSAGKARYSMVTGRRHDDSFSRAVQDHHKDLVRFAYVLCGDADLAEEVVAEAYARVWPRWHRRNIDDFGRYLRRTVANQVYGTFRRRRVERRHLERRHATEPDGLFEGQIDDRDALWRAVGQLSPQQRVVVVLRFLDDMSEGQTAAVLGVPVGTVKSRLSRALSVMRGYLEDHHV